MRLLIAGILTLIIYLMICIYGREEAPQVEKNNLPGKGLIWSPEKFKRLLNDLYPLYENHDPLLIPFLPQEKNYTQTFANV